MKVLMIVNEAPWGSTVGDTALRMARATLTAGHELAAVFFRGEGVYHAETGRVADQGTLQPSLAWQSLSEQDNVPLLLCSADSQRRLSGQPASSFREAGLPEVMSLSADCQRVLTF